jgi:type IV pilus assembly protein PilB
VSLTPEGRPAPGSGGGGPAAAQDPFWLGRELVQAGTVTAEQFASARALWRRNPREEFSALLERLGLASPAQLAAALGRRHALPVATVAGRSLDRAAARLIPPDLARRKCLVPLRRENRRLDVAVADPAAYGAQDARRDFPDHDVCLQVAPRAEILGLIEETWRSPDTEGGAQAAFERLLKEAVAERATDLHLEPRERSLDVRQRIDGRLVHAGFIEEAQRDALLQAAKIAGRMDIAERRRPQDGRSTLVVGARPYHLRFSCIPAVNGESIVIRIIDEAAGVRPFAELDLFPMDRRHLESLLRHPHGLVYVTGPTGSGKTTLLHSLLHQLPPAEINELKIITLEEPVELRLPRFFLQLEVDERIGRTFSELLRHVLRHDPNIVLVGETRDRATAEITLRTALTGRLCFSTLHTTGAWAAVTRLTEMGLDPLVLATALKGVIAQRLVRRPCLECARPHPQAERWQGRFAALLAADRPGPAGLGFVEAQSGRACARCRGRGYHGRTSIVEVFPLAGAEPLIAERAPEEIFLRHARPLGCRTLFEDGVRKAACGLTTMEEICAAVEAPGA